MGVMDRLTERLFSVARAALAGSDYVGTFRAKLLKGHPNLRRVDVQPDSPDLPPLTNIPLKVGVPGIEVTLPSGHIIQVQWEDGRPDRPFATLWDPGTGGAKPLKATWHTDVLELGGTCVPIKDGVVTGQGQDPYTGLPYWMLGNSSGVVGAKK